MGKSTKAGTAEIGDKTAIIGKPLSSPINGCKLTPNRSQYDGKHTRFKGSNMSDDAVKLTLRISPDVKKIIDKMSSDMGGVSITEVIRRALGTEHFLLEEKKNGNKILVENETTGKQKEIVFR